jgi:hypothetical protein
MYYWADGAVQAESLERRLRVAEGHIEAGRLLAFYQVGSFLSVTIKLVCLKLFMKGISKSFNLMVEMKVSVLTMCHHNLDCTIFVLHCFPPLLFSNMILKFLLLLFSQANVYYVTFSFYAGPKAIKLFPRGSIR